MLAGQNVWQDEYPLPDIFQNLADMSASPANFVYIIYQYSVHVDTFRCRVSSEKMAPDSFSRKKPKGKGSHCGRCAVVMR